MLITTSATTVTTVRYLSIQELEQYKKQFQSFWIPFMEQFIPATTIWVAGERWCNEPCPVISPCDYDFEFVEGMVDVIKTGSGALPTEVPKEVDSPKGWNRREVILPIISEKSFIIDDTTAQRVLKTPLFSPVEDLGLNKTVPNTVENYNLDIANYRNKFTPIEIETV
jgi:hypothetical protein